MQEHERLEEVHEEPEESLKPKPKKIPGWLREFGYLAFVFGLTFLVIQPFVLASYDTPTGSMEPTIMTNTRYLALPSIYGGFARFSNIKLPGFKPIHRGDIVIFKFPLDETKNYVKRVIGLPGDKVEIRGKTVYVNGKALIEHYVQFSDDAYYKQNPAMSRSSYGPVTVPKDHLFVMGDNRDNSYDSRYWGFLPVKNVFGTPLISFWSYDQQHRQVRLGEILKPIK